MQTKGPVLLAALAVVTQAFAGAAAPSSVVATITHTIEARFPKLSVLNVQPSPLPGLYEVYTGTELFYTDKSGDYLFSGSLIDTRTQKDLTAEGVDARNAIDFATLPFDKAIKIVKGTGERKLAIFTDPDCPYCQALEKEMKDVTDVTVYTFLFPLTQIHPNAAKHAHAIWCADDRAQAWTAWMQEKKEPETKTCDGDPVDMLNALGQRLHIAGTPTLYFETGHRLSHGLSAADLEKALKDNARGSLPQANAGASPNTGCLAPSASAGTSAAGCINPAAHPN